MKRDERKVVLRCAVYTRVSTDSGLEQDFSSLDNQREASDAYIKSQAHEGWKLVRERYETVSSKPFEPLIAGSTNSCPTPPRASSRSPSARAKASARSG
jgi:hypothetical protein